MTYFGFLFLFLGIPIVVLAILNGVAWRRGWHRPDDLCGWRADYAVVLLVVLAVVYTTPWDNYLVATRVWWYDPDLVCGVVLGWVPLEEYTFFVLQPVFTGLLLLLLARTPLVRPRPSYHSRRMRNVTVVVVDVVWLAALIALLSDWPQATYAGLELTWALIPITIQVGFGADILWRYRELVLVTLALSSGYLAFADMLAIDSGTWTIDPEQSLPFRLGGILPLEELLFFVLTNVLVVFGITLAVARDSHNRWGFLSRNQAAHTT